MIYKSTEDCIQEVVRTMGTVSVEQLLRYFRNAPDKDNLQYYIEELIRMRVFDYIKPSNWVRYHNSPKLNETEERRRVMAFWVVADFGYDNIRELYVLRAPWQLLMITEDNNVFDIAVCVNKGDAIAMARAIPQAQIAGVPDEVNHIAIVREKEMGATVLPYGFDSCCILDENKSPHYYDKKALSQEG